MGLSELSELPDQLKITLIFIVGYIIGRIDRRIRMFWKEIWKHNLE